MSSAVAPAQALPRAGAPSRWPLIRSLLLNLLGPYLVFRLTEAHFSKDSPMPLLIAALIPAGELALGLARRRALDVIAILSLVQLSVSVAISMAASSALAAITGHAFQPAALGLVFGASLLLGRPLMRPLARVSMAGDDPDRQARFDAAAATPRGRRAFALITLAWSTALCLETVVLLMLTRTLAMADYLLVSNIVSFVVMALLIWASIGYGRRAARASPTPAPVPAP